MSLVVCIRKKQALAKFGIFCRLLLILLWSGILLLRFSASCLDGCAGAGLSGFTLRLALAL